MKLPLFSVFVAALLSVSQVACSIDLKGLSLPDGYQISVFADQVTNARQLAVSPTGIVYAGSRKGVVSAVIDHDGDGRADQVLTIADDWNMPSGLALKDNDLYVAAVSQIYRSRDIDQQITRLLADDTPIKWEVVYNKLPNKRSHGWKFIAFGPDDHLYVPVGAPCNICDDPDPRFNTLLKLNKDFSGHQVYADGIRNTVGFDWSPKTGKLWFTDNGRDHLGDDFPPEELNRVDSVGQHFGYPYVHAGDILDPEFGKDKNIADYTPPQHKFPAHVAPLGVHFYSGKAFTEFKDNAFIALHGSWNRSKKVGYKIARVSFKDDQVVVVDDFISGWLIDEQVSGRPVDIAEMSDGSILISDDAANVIYRVTKK